MASLDDLHRDIRACRICVERPTGLPLPHAPNPVVVLSQKAKIVICGQAPGNRVNQSGRPFTDPSGDRLRDWLGVSETQFYNPDNFAIVPMGFCFPGHDSHGGDLPPRPECRERWHDEIFSLMPQIELKILVGGSAQHYHLGGMAEKTVTATVANWRQHLIGDKCFAMPHPSWRNTGWIRKNPWFESDLLPVLRKMIHERVNSEDLI